jgi:hypothetical protein
MSPTTITAIRSGSIPILVEPQQLLTRCALDDVGIADWRPVRVARSFELRAADLVAGALARTEMQPPLGQHDAAFTFDRGLVEGGRLRPVLQHQQRAIEHVGRIGRHAQRVLRLVVAVAALASGPIPNPIEDRKSMIPCRGKCVVPSNSMCSTKCANPSWSGSSSTDPALTTRAELDATGGPLVLTDVVAQSVRQRADGRLPDRSASTA